MFSRQIFRDKSLQQLSSPEQLDQLMQITQPRSWISLLGLCALLALFSYWSVFGVIPIEIDAPAVFLKSGGIKQIASTVTGQVSDIYIAAGDIVEEGQPIAALQLADGSSETAVISPFSGRILSINIAVGTPIQSGSTIANLESVGSDVQQEAILYLPAADSRQIEPGMRVYLEPHALPDTTVGAFVGEVIAVGSFPITRDHVQQQIGNSEVVSALNLPANALEVRIRLRNDTTSVGGYAWSAAQSPDYIPISGTLARARIKIGEQQPIGFVLPVKSNQ